MRALIIFAHYVPLIAAATCIGLAYRVHDRGGDPDSIVSLGINALICIAVFFVFDYPRLRYARRSLRLRKTGRIVQARVIKAEQTARYVNLQPQFRLKLSFINPETGQKVVTSVNDYFDIREAASMRPGTVLTIRFNPDKPEEISLA